MGVKVDRSKEGWEVTVLPVNLSEKGKQLFKQDTLVGLPIGPYRSRD